MSQERFAIALQQDLITLLVYDDKHGRVVSKLVNPALFEGDYRTIAERSLDFWKDYNVAPKQHIADLLADILNDKADRRGTTYRRILISMQEMHDKINIDFVLRSMTQFVRLQKAKETILSVAEKLDAQGINGLAEAESALGAFLRERHVDFDDDLQLNQVDAVIDYLEASTSEFITGIKELDQNHIVPMRGKLWLFMAPAKRGKTWMLVQLGKMAFMQRKKVLHISLEIEKEEVAQRYYQALFGASKRDDLNKISTFKMDRAGELDQIVQETIEAPFTFQSQAIREELKTRIGHFGPRAENFRIKRFPMSSLTMDQLEAYLETLKTLHGFEPDLVIMDYPKIMKLNKNDLRISLGGMMEELRGLSQRKNFALAAVHQGNRASDSAELVKAAGHLSEDWSIAGTVDFFLTYSQTPAERKLNLARIFVDLARSEADKFGVLITQSYKTGQFILESTPLSDAYAEMMEHMGTADDDEEETSRHYDN